MRSYIVLLGVLLLAGGAATAMQTSKEFELVPAQLICPRDGLGNTFAKLKAGKELRIAYFGGSITAQEGWRVKTLKWFRDTWPNTKITEINATIGGTGSDLGVYRMAQDVLTFKPDLIFVEFAVNDGDADPLNVQRGMEGIVRQAWRANPQTDICYVYTYANGFERDLDRGLCPRAASADERLADWYNIPSINVAMRTATLARDGKLIYTPKKNADGKPLPAPEGVILFSTDGVHPLDAGHVVYTDLIIEALQEMQKTSRPTRHRLKAPLQPDNWERARLDRLRPAMLSPGWVRLDASEGLGHVFANRMPEIWEARKPGETISFRFKGTAVKLYDLMGPDGGQAVVTVDGQASPPRPRFDSFCSYHRLATLSIADGLADTVHTVTVTIHPDQPDRRSVTDIERTKPGFDPKKYDGTVLRVGAILLIGEIVP